MNFLIAPSSDRFALGSARSSKFLSAAVTLLLFGSGLALALRGEPSLPTTADNSAKAKVDDDAAVDEAFKQWTAALPAEQRSWEAVLELNLGTYYLPRYKREKLAGTPSPFDYVADDPQLPRVLLIGDSISNGYTRATRAALAGRANVHRAPENCGPTANGLKKLDVWLGDTKWDVIHFNFGIHDRATPLADYVQRLEQIVQRLKGTGARLIWATTTPIPRDETKKQIPEAILERNEAAERIMRVAGIPIDDLYTWIAPDIGRFQIPGDVHFKPDGYARLAERVAQAIRAELPAPAVANTAIIAVGRLEKDSYDWEDRHAKVMAIKDRLQPETVLIGDSITHFWGGEPIDENHRRGQASWDALFGTRPVLNLGFGWDRTQNVLKRIELGELDGLDPKSVVIHIGGNNLTKTAQARNNSPAEIAEGVERIIEQVQAKCAHARIILMAIFPRGKDPGDPRRALIAETNRWLAMLAGNPRVSYVDLTPAWLGPDGTIPTEIMQGAVHPTEKGYEVWATALRSALPPQPR